APPLIPLAPDEGGPWTIAEDRGELWLRVRNSRYDPGTAAEHPPHSWAHRDFTARRLIRDVFAVRERLSDPRVVPSFRCTFLPDMPPSPTPGSSDIISSKFTMPTWSSPREHGLDTPNTSTIRFT